MSRTALPASRLPSGRAPLYSRLRQAIRDRVISGEWRPGDQIPTIRQLGDSYGVSRITVVQALDGLARDGMLVRWQGKGVFVGQAGPDEASLPLLSFTEELLGGGQQPGSRTLRLRLEATPPHVRGRLSLKAGDPVVLLERVRLADGEPVAVQQAYLPAQLVPGLTAREEPIESLYRVLADTYGTIPTSATETYQPIRLAADQARLLDARMGALAFQVDRTTCDQHGRTIAFTTSARRADRHPVNLRLSRSAFAASSRAS